MKEDQTNNRRFSELATLLVIVGIWVSVACLINPCGDFPLADDWAYSRAVKTLLEDGRLRFVQIVTPNIIGQVVWGALFCLPFGFSFTTLRISTLTLGAVGVLALYGLLREAYPDHKTALFGSLLLAFNPHYLVLAYTFMSDVPFTAITILSIYFLARGMKGNSRLEVATGLLVACAALLIRQAGLAIFVGFGLAYLVKSGLRLRNLGLASLPAVLGVIVQIVWDRWMQYKQISPAFHSLQAGRVLSPQSYLSWLAAEHLAAGFVTVFVYLGLFLFPLLLLVIRRSWTDPTRSRILTLTTLACAAVAAYELSYRRMPLVPNVFYDFGLGTATLRDAYLLKMRGAGEAFWFVVTEVGFAGAVALLYLTLIAIGKAVKLRTPGTSGNRELMVMLLACGLFYIVPVAILNSIGEAYDRYVLFLVPLGITTIIIFATDVGPSKTWSSAIALAVVSLALYGSFSVAGTHDYLSWNRARWQALNDLMTERRLPASQIDGGYEFNGWSLRDSEYRTTPQEKLSSVDRDDFLVAFGPVQGFTEIRRYPYRRWIAPAQGNILVLQRIKSNARGR